MLTSNLNATRFAQKPLYQPTYSFANVPKADRDLSHSSLQFVESRDDFHQAMGEMLLLCKEAVRRRPSDKLAGGSKPLSLEYLADRFDIDDPLFGYLVRTQVEPPGRTRGDNASSKWQKGMLQGFVTVTTFTNYQRTFQWNSHHPAAFTYDDDDLIMERLNGERKFDEDGSLAAGMQSSVRCGDIWNEGIVWPRIAEISLLGGLGCGAALVKLVIEHLECMRPSAKCNYDYVVLQATDNSVSFYESMGFVRVGAIVKEENVNQPESDDDDEYVVAEPLPSGSPEKANAVAQTSDIITSPLTQYTTKKPGETPKDIAKRFEIDVWDIIFLNKDIYADICPTSRLLAGTILHLPIYEKFKSPLSLTKQKSKDAGPLAIPQYYIAKEDDTPREIAKKFNVPCSLLVDANKGRLEGLVSSSRLMAGTRVKVSHLDVLEDDFKPYPHWSFPDDTFDDPEPSYMMAYKLNRKRGSSSGNRPVLASLAVPISKFEPTDLVIPPSPGPIDYDVSDPPGSVLVRSFDRNSSAPLRKKNSRRCPIPGAPVPPKRTSTAFLLYVSDIRKKKGEEVKGLSGARSNKVLGSKWATLSADEKAPYEVKADQLREQYFKDKAAYEEKLAAFVLNNPQSNVSMAQSMSSASSSTAMPVTGANIGMSLYNKVVRLKPGAMTEGSEFTYWYVLTYIPDLKWCHLAPMMECGTFGCDKPKSLGRTKYRLVDEKLGKEVDISSSFCIPIKARAMKRTLDADMEEWDVIDDGSEADMEIILPQTSSSARRDSGRSTRTSPNKPSAIPKLSTGLKNNKRSRVSGGQAVSTSVSVKSFRLPEMVAVSPKSKRELTVRLVGKGIYDPHFDYPARPIRSHVTMNTARLMNGTDEVIIEIVPSKKIGRPKGSKNKPKKVKAIQGPVEVGGMSVLSSPLTRGQRPRPASPSRSTADESSRFRKRVRLLSPRGRSKGEYKENFVPEPAEQQILRVKSQSLNLSTDSTEPAPRRNSRLSSKTKAVAMPTQVLLSSSPRRLLKSPVTSSHKRTRHCKSPTLPVADKRSLRSSASPATSNNALCGAEGKTSNSGSPTSSRNLQIERQAHLPRTRSGNREAGLRLSIIDRPKRKAAPSFLGMDLVSPAEKRLCVN